jgi:hypothetical protein
MTVFGKETASGPCVNLRSDSAALGVVVTVSERLNLNYHTILDAYSLHQLIGSEIEGPDLNLGLTTRILRTYSRPDAARNAIDSKATDLRRLTAGIAHLSAAVPYCENTAAASDSVRPR